MSSSLKQKTLNGVIWTLADNVSSQVISLVVMVVLAQYLYPSDFGLVGMLIIFVALSNAFINSGFSAALIQKKIKCDADFSTAFITNLIVACLIYTLLFFFSYRIADFYSTPELTLVARVYFIVLIIDSLCLVPNAKLTIELNFKLLTKVRVVSTVISASLAIFLAINGYGVWAIVYQAVIFSLMRFLLLITFVRIPNVFCFSKTSFDQLFGFGSKLLITKIFATLTDNLQTVLIGRYFHISDVGYYVQGMKASGVISAALMQVTHTVSFPVLSQVQSEHKRFLSIYKRVIKMAAFITFPIMVGFSLVSETFVTVFLTDKWLPSVPIIQYLSLAAIFLPLSAVNLNILNAKGRADLFMKADLSVFPINIIIIFSSVNYGIEGVALGVIFSRVFGYIIHCYYPGKLFCYGFFQQVRDIIPTIFCTCLMAVVIVLMDFSQTLAGMFLTFIVGATAYSFFAFLFKVDSFNELISIIKQKC